MEAANDCKIIPAGERQLLMKNVFIRHDRFNDAWNFLRRSHFPVEGGAPDYGCMSALVGESRAGKTSVAKKYMAEFPATMAEGAMVYPVVYVDIPIDGQRALLGFLAEALGIKYSLRINNPTLRSMIFKALVDQRVELLIFDEVNTMVRADNKRSQTYTLDLFRKILDHCHLNIVCIGLLETYNLLVGDVQLTGRGGLPYHVVRPYNWENGEEQKLFRYLCDTFDEKLPFNQKSKLGSAACAQRLYYSSHGGIVGRLRDFIYSAGCIAINDSADFIEPRHFGEAYERTKMPGQIFNPWVHPMDQAPKLNTAPSKVAGLSARDAFSKTKYTHAG